MGDTEMIRAILRIFKILYAFLKRWSVDNTSRDLKYAVFKVSWSTHTLDSTGDVGLYTSIAINDGDIYISYVGGNNLKLAYFEEEEEEDGVKIPKGIVALTDNLFRPLAGGKCSIKVTTYASGRLTMKLYTITGQFVKKVFDGHVSAGAATAASWSGKTSKGNTVASGVYLLHVHGPQIDTTKKIIVVK